MKCVFVKRASYYSEVRMRRVSNTIFSKLQDYRKYYRRDTNGRYIVAPNYYRCYSGLNNLSPLWLQSSAKKYDGKEIGDNNTYKSKFIRVERVVHEKVSMLDTQSNIYDQIIDIIPFIDPDTSRMIEWIWARRIKAGLDCHSEQIVQPIDNMVDFTKLHDVFNQYVDHCYTAKHFYRGIKIDKQNNIIELYVVAEHHKNGYEINIFGNREQVISLYNEANKLFEINVSITIDTLIGFTMEGKTINSPCKLLQSEQKFATDQFYPWLTEGIDSFIEQYKNSGSAVLVLIGAPGTGKTSFLKSLMFKLNKTNIGLITSDNASLNPNLPKWLMDKGNDSLIAVEDADNLVGSRENGNTQMSSILNYAEGVIASNVKLVISTNLSSTNKIDPALIRPGRAYRVLNFRSLTADEANNARQSIGLPKIENLNQKLTYTLSEILNYVDVDDLHERKRPGIGFSSTSVTI